MGGYTICGEVLKLEDVDQFDWRALQAKVEAFDLGSLGQYSQIEFLHSAAQLKGDEISAQADRTDDVAELAALFEAGEIRQLLLDDIERIQRIAGAPAEFECDYDNYATFGIGFTFDRIGAHALLRGELCCEMVGAGTESARERGQTPYETMLRLRIAGVSAGESE